MTLANLNTFDRKRGKDGFALILALGLTAFVLLLLLAMTTLGRLQTGINEARSHRLQARQNALLGFQIALGELQKLSGPDRRITARSDIQGESLENPYWTGVWSTEETNGKPIWLVSGENPDPSNQIAGIPLAKNSAENQGVTAALVPISTENQQGNYAYWVSGEGVKASLAKTDRVDELNAALYNELFRKRLRQLSPVRPGREVFYPEMESKDREVIREGLLKSATFNQIANVPGFPDDELRKFFFDATHISYGVLSNTGDGGLKTDLSAADIQDSGFPFLDSLQRASKRRINEEGFVEYPGLGQPANLNSGGFLNAPSPLTTEFALFVGIFKNSLESDLFLLELGYWSELWNPYSFPIAFDPETDNDLVNKISGLPVIQVDWEANRGQNNNRIGSFSIDLDDFIINFGIPLAEGEVKTRIARISHVLELSLPIGTVNNPAKNIVSISAPSSTLTVQYFSAFGQFLREVRNLRFESFNTNKYGLSRVATPSRTNPNHFQFAFHYKLLDDTFPLAEGQK